MKYALNNANKFQSYKVAFLGGFVQASVIFLVETLNIIAIMEAKTVFDIVLNFVSMVIISEFDNFIYGSLRNEKLKTLLSEENQMRILRINFTTS